MTKYVENIGDEELNAVVRDDAAFYQRRSSYAYAVARGLVDRDKPISAVVYQQRAELDASIARGALLDYLGIDRWEGRNA